MPELRDSMAMHALVGIVGSDQWQQVVINEAVTKDKRVFRVVAESAYALADAMIEEREVGRNTQPEGEEG